eukprot:Seg690.10 transcript_id=Seg690.10/GoldUCD/mRNA.D3Y31 product="hypothetical protein" protein_id=Seg690.10/GoldUCD/D3Y31
MQSLNGGMLVRGNLILILAECIARTINGDATFRDALVSGSADYDNFKEKLHGSNNEGQSIIECNSLQQYHNEGKITYEEYRQRLKACKGTVLTDTRPTATSDNIRGGIRIYFTEQDMTDAHQKRLNQITSTENDNTPTEDNTQSGNKLQELLLTANSDKQINSRHELYQNPTTLQFKFKTESPSSLRTVASPLLIQNSVRNKLGVRQRRAAGRKQGSRNHRGQQEHGGHQNIKINGASWFKKYQALYNNAKRTTYQPEEGPTSQWLQRSPEAADSQRAAGSRTGHRSLLSNIAYTRPAVVGIFNKQRKDNARRGQLRGSILSPSPVQDYALHRIGLKDDASFMEASPNFDRSDWTLNAVQSLIPKAQAKDFIPRPQQKPLEKMVRVEKSQISMVVKPEKGKMSQNAAQHNSGDLSKKTANPNAKNGDLLQAGQAKNANINIAKSSNGKNGISVVNSNQTMKQGGKTIVAMNSNRPVVSNQRVENMELINTTKARLEKGQQNVNRVTKKPVFSSQEQTKFGPQRNEAGTQQGHKNINPMTNDAVELKKVGNNVALNGGEAMSQRDQNKMADNKKNALEKHDTTHGLNLIENPLLANKDEPTMGFDENTNYERSAIPRPKAKPSHEDNDIRLNFYKEMKKPPTHFDDKEAENNKRDVIYRDINPSSEIDSDDITAENLAAIFNELDGEIDSVLREDVSKKDLISRPQDDVARTQDEIEMTVYNDRNDDRSESNVNFVSVDGKKDSGVNFEQKQELTPIETEENVTGVTKTLPKEKFDLKRLHFGLRNGNTFD